MPKAILITQCLQNDFVCPIGSHDPLPNRLHIGARESQRLMGLDPAEGPVARMMEWAQQQSAGDLLLVHIRDWHSAGDHDQASHLQQFGDHCLAGSRGADFAFAVPAQAARRQHDVQTNDVQSHNVQSLTLNDFHSTPLADLLAPFAGGAVPVGIMGVWTEAKVLFLCYELATRYPKFQLAVCSALTASSSRAQHFAALDQLQRILGVRICSSVGEFLEFLGGSAAQYPLPGGHSAFPKITIDSGPPLKPGDDELLRYLFRDCRSLNARVLDGGFSGNVVLGVSSVDLHGHKQVLHVVKIGPRNMIGQERTAFERIEEVLGNNAPHVSDFADLGERGAIKYRYASMGGTQAATFQKRYTAGLEPDKVRAVLQAVFLEQLGKLYAAAELETCNLLEYYCFSSRWAGNVRARVEDILGRPADGAELTLSSGACCPNLCRFYEETLDGFDVLRRDSAYFAYVHGDLNGANIILDAHENVWLIDFFHTHRGHVLKDLIKLENDLLYIFTPVPDAEALEEAAALTDLLLTVEDLAAPLPELPAAISAPQLVRAYETIKVLREFYPALIKSDRSPLQWLIAALRYAVHTLSFDESAPLQKEWALYTAAHCSTRVAEMLSARRTLRLDQLDSRYTAPGRLSITILPGRKDQQRELEEDLQVLKREGVSAVVCLATAAELADYGVPELQNAYRAAGLAVYHLPILDQKVCSPAEMEAAVKWLKERLSAGAAVVVHCVGGLGRSGLLAGCYLRSVGLTADEAMAEVRRVRSQRAIESAAQEEFLHNNDQG